MFFEYIESKLIQLYFKLTEGLQMSKDDTQPGTPATHDNHDMPCDEHHTDCSIKLHGHIRCEKPDCHPPLEYVNRMISVSCGADDPSPQISAYQALPANLHAELVQIVDLGHNGWAIWFRIPSIYV